MIKNSYALITIVICLAGITLINNMYAPHGGSGHGGGGFHGGSSHSGGRQFHGRDHNGRRHHRDGDFDNDGALLGLEVGVPLAVGIGAEIESSDDDSSYDDSDDSDDNQ